MSENGGMGVRRRARSVLCPEDAVLVTTPGVAPEGLNPNWLRDREPREGRATAYACRGVTCSLPVTNPAALIALPGSAGEHGSPRE